MAVWLSTIRSIPIYAADNTYQGKNSQPEKIKVGFFQFDGYHEIKEDGRRTGYGYDFLQMIAGYENFEYEYIGYGKSWSKMQQMLKDGEIDLLTSAQKLPKREADFDFSEQSIGVSSTILTTSASAHLYSAGDYAGYNGMRVGLLKNNSRNLSFEKYAAEKGFSYIPVYFENQEDMKAAMFYGKQIDAMVTSDLRQIENEIILDKFDSSAFYVMVKKGNTALLEKVNHAIVLLNSDYPSWKSMLAYKYYNKSSGGKEIVLTADEQSYLNELHAKGKTVRVLINPGIKPYSYFVAHKPKGIMVDIMERVAEKCGIPYEIMETANTAEYYEAMKSGAADLVIDSALSYSQAEDMGYFLTASYFSAGFSRITMKDHSGDYRIVAARRGAADINHPYQEMYGSMKVKEYDTTDECVRAVMDGEADCTFTYTCVAEMYVRSDIRNQLTYTTMQNPPTSFSIAVLREKGAVLYPLMNKIADSISGEEVQKIIDENMELRESDASFLSYLYKNPIVPVVFLTILAVGFVLIVVLFYRGKEAQSERKQRQALEEQMKKERDYQNQLARTVEEANRANHAKSEFLSRMSHDIRTPMNGIMGMLDIIKKNRYDEERVDDCIQKIETSAGYLLTLINDVLEMSRIESGRLSLTEESFDLNEMLVNNTRITRQFAIEYGVTIYCDSPKQMPHTRLIGSPLHVRQILMNIESNAVKYNKPGGIVDCSVEEIASTEDTATYCFRVADTGIGMSEEFMEHIFEPFNQEKSDSRTTFNGSGLGMSIVKKMVDAMHGTITVESTVGEGSVFLVTLTFQIDKCPHQNSQKGRYAGSRGLEGARILLVEDNELNMEIARFMLEEAGAMIDTAESGQIAVDKFTQSEPGSYQIVLMDIMMPVMDGLTASKAIRASDKADAKTIPIIAMTANAFAEDVKNCLDAGMNAHIAKPLDYEDVLNTVCPFTEIDEAALYMRKNGENQIGENVKENTEEKDEIWVRPQFVSGYGLNEWEKKMNLKQYNHELFAVMKVFTDSCWQIDLEKATVVALQEWLHPELIGRQSGYHQIVAEFAEKNVYEDDQELWHNVMDLYQLRRLKEEFAYQIRMRTREGKLLYFRVMLNPSFDKDGKTNVVYLAAKVTASM